MQACSKIMSEAEAREIAEDESGVEKTVYEWKSNKPTKKMSVGRVQKYFSCTVAEARRWEKSNPKLCAIARAEIEECLERQKRLRKEWGEKNSQDPDNAGAPPGPVAAEETPYTRAVNALIRQHILYPQALVAGVLLPAELVLEGNQKDALIAELEGLREFAISHPIYFGKATDLRTTSEMIDHISFMFRIRRRVERPCSCGARLNVKTKCSCGHIDPEVAKYMIHQHYMQNMATSDSDWFKSDTHLLMDDHPLADVSGVEGIYPLSPPALEELETLVLTQKPIPNIIYEESIRPHTTRQTGELSESAI